jgi:hypothetical protein
MPIPGLDIGGVTLELKLRLQFYYSWNWCFSFLLFFVCLIVCFLIVGSLFFISIPIIFFSFLYYQLNHYHLLILTVTPLTLCPSPVQKSISSLPNNSFYPFSSTLSPSPHFTLSFFPQPVTRLPLPLTHSSLTDQPLYQLYTTPNPCNP